MSVGRSASGVSLCNLDQNVRYHIFVLVTPTPYPKHRSSMGLPDSDRTLSRKIPQNDPTIGVAGEKPQIFSEEVDTVNLSRMTSKNV